MIRIEQRNAFDCGVACLAMLTGKRPEDIERRLGYCPADTVLDRLDLGLVADEAVMVLLNSGRLPVSLVTVHAIEAWGPEATVASLSRRRLIPTNVELLKLAAGRAAMFAVALRYDRRRSHWIAWNGAAVIDPSPRRRYTEACLATAPIYTAVICFDPLPAGSSAPGLTPPGD